ncbi:MAG: T9SS type A sorting domain-containing protein, partial [Bacteroidia bacterium]
FTPSTSGQYAMIAQDNSTSCQDTSSCRYVDVSCTGFSVSVSPSNPPTLCPGETITLTASGATSYTWNTGQTGPSIVVSQPGSYYAIGTSGNCQATSNTVVVSYHPPVDTAVQLTGTTLSPVNVRPNYTYRWINCANPGTILHTGTSFTPSTSGQYAMIAQDNSTSCQDTSRCYFVGITTSSVFPTNRGIYISLYPNPTEGPSWLVAEEAITQVEVRDLAGRLLQRREGYANRWLLEEYSAGTYIVQVWLERGATAILRWHVLR